MVLVTHNTQSSYAAVHLRTPPWSKGIRLKQNVIRLSMIARVDNCLFRKQTSPLRLAARPVRDAKGKPLQILSFKGNVHSEEAGNGSSESLVPKTSVKFSFVRQDREETLPESPAARETAVPNGLESDQSKYGYLTVHGLFSKWLSVLRTDVPRQVGDISKGTPQVDIVQEPKEASTKEVSTRGGSEILKVVFGYVLGVDAAITVPLLTFIPLYLAVNVIYGAEVSRELTPLWVIGPLMVALYVKLLQGIISLYAFSLKQNYKVIKSMPTYCSRMYKYVEENIWGPVINLKNENHKELAARKWKAFEEWMIEQYLDFVESIWPTYWRVLRFLKGANFL